MDKTPTSIAPLLGFAFASASALLAIWVLSYGYAIGGFALHDPLLLAGIRTGVALSFVGLVCAGIGLRRPNRMRWIGLAWASVSLLFWVGTVAIK